MYIVAVAPVFTQSFQKLDAENFFRITKEYPLPHMQPDSATIPALNSDKGIFTIILRIVNFIPT